MRLCLRFYDAVGYQDDGFEMATTFVDAQIQSDDGEIKLTLGRLFFEPDMMDKLIGDGPVLVAVTDDRERSGNNVGATAA